MKIAISGVSRYVGQHLTLFFTERGDEVVPLGKNLFKEENFDELCHRVESCDVVINLASASINKCWAKVYKQELYDSRIRTTHQLVNAISTRGIFPKLFISTFAIDYYPTSGEYDEYNNRRGGDFLARLCGAWEEETRACLPDVQLVIARFGVVLSEDDEALRQMLQLQRLSRTGVVVGDSQQSFPWISVHDLCRSSDFMIQNSTLRGVVSPVSPRYITQEQLAYALTRADGTRWVMPLSTLIFRLMFGKGASFVTEGQTVHPTKLLEPDFTCDYPTIEKLMNITDYRTVQVLDVRRYMGRWYEIARYENHLEKGMTDVTATYTLRSDGRVRVEDEGFKDGIHKKAVGRAKQPESENSPGKLKVAFFLWFCSDYYVFELDEYYQYIVVGSSSDKYLWILSRDKSLPEAVMGGLLGKIMKRGYDISKLTYNRI